MVDVSEDLRLSSTDDESEEFSSSDEFWYKAGQNSSLASNCSTTFESSGRSDAIRSLTKSTHQTDENCAKTNSTSSIGKMTRLMKKTLKLESRSASKRVQPSKYVQLEFVTRRFVEISDDFTSETLKLLECLNYLCDSDERCATCFVQNKGLRRLRDVVRRYVTLEYYWTKYKLDQSSGNLHMMIGIECVRLLACLSQFQSTHSYVEPVNLAPLIVNLFDPLNAFFAQEVTPNDLVKETIQLALTKINSDKVLTFVRRSLPVASYPVCVYLFDPTDEKSPKFFEFSSSLPYSFDILPDLLDANAQSTLKMIRIVNFVDSCTFWAINVVDQKRVLLEVLKLCGTNAVTQLGYCKEMPNVGDMLLAPGDKTLTGVSDIYRCLILERLNLDSVVVFAVDFGFYAKLSFKSLRNLNESVKKLTAAAFLCVAKDFIPAPDETTMRNLFAAVHNLSVYPIIAESFTRNDCSMDLSFISRRAVNTYDDVFRKFWMSSETLNKSDCVLSLLNFLKLPVVDHYEAILIQVLNVCCEFAAHSRVRPKLNNWNFVEILLDMSLKIVELCKSDESKSFLLLPLVKCLANLCDGSNEGKKSFEKCNGLVLPASLTVTYPENHELHQAANVLLKNVFPDKITSENFAETIENLGTRSMSTNENDYLEKFLSETVRLKNSIPRGFRLTDTILRSYCLTSDSKDIRKEIQEELLEPNCNVRQILERLSLPRNRGRYFVKNSYFEFETNTNVIDPLWEVVSDVTNMKSLKTQIVQEFVCAALNSRCRLTIFYGINKDKQMKGIKADISDRDQLRVGLDFALSRAFRPILQPNMYSIEFVPVFLGGKDLKPIDDCFVIEIKICHIATDVYQLEDTGQIYVKQNDRPCELSMNEARQFFASQLESKEEKRIENLRRDIQIFESILKR